MVLWELQVNKRNSQHEKGPRLCLSLASDRRAWTPRPLHAEDCKLVIQVIHFLGWTVSPGKDVGTCATVSTVRLSARCQLTTAMLKGAG